MARMNRFVEKLESGEPAFCCVLQSGDVYAARRLGESDVDLIMIDVEHEGFDFPRLGDTLQWLISRRQINRDGAAVASPTPVVRIPQLGHDQWVVKQTLDYGVFGLVIPHVQTADQLRELVGSARYPQPKGETGPEGHRGVSPFVAPRYWGLETFEEYVDKADLWPFNPEGELILIAMIEDSLGFANIGEIVQVAGLGAVLFGPGDGARSLGARHDFAHPDLLAARAGVADACLNAGVPVGAAGVNDPETYDEHIEQGFRFFLSFEEHTLGLKTRLAVDRRVPSEG